MKGETLIALLADPLTSTNMKKTMNIKKGHTLETYNIFPMTSQGLRKVCVGEKARPQDILRPKSCLFFETSEFEKNETCQQQAA